MAKTTIGASLREARQRAKLSNRDLSRMTGLATGAISQIELGSNRDPGFSTVLKLARAIGISMEDLAVRFEGGTEADVHTAETPVARLKRAVGIIEATIGTLEHGSGKGAQRKK